LLNRCKYLVSVRSISAYRDNREHRSQILQAESVQASKGKQLPTTSTDKVSS
jgi:hypothetical protein